MSLPSNQFTICNKAYGLYVGRPQREDKSLLPKPIVALPEGVRSAWTTKSSKPNTSILMVGGAPTAAITNQVFAILLPEPPATTWKIMPVPQAGANTYLITKADNPSQGWVMPSGQSNTQVAVRPLIMGPSDPPYYPPNQLWTIIPQN
ncbi:hypothetical protein FRB93_007272 [Tulasnella sp. JGI-2019a]|nr:hypothetical protein FRB93_007272 [Tulasnella sp. JGI-2019a]